MTSNVEQVWKQYYDQAVSKAAEFGYTTNDQKNAFAHTYVSALLVRDYGGTAAYVAGTGQELRNHWAYRNGGNEPADPHQRFDTF